MSALIVTVQRQGDAGPGEPRQFTAGPVEIGRHPENDLVLPESTVSRKHARFELRGDGLWHLVDLGSAHGTYLNKQRVSAVMVPSRCEVYINPFVLKVSIARPEPAPSTAAELAPGEGSTVMEVSGKTPPAPAPAAPDQPVGTILDFAGSTPPRPARPAVDAAGVSIALDIEGGDGDEATNVQSARADEPAPAPTVPPPKGDDVVVGTLFDFDSGKVREGIATQRARKAGEGAGPARPAAPPRPLAPTPKPAAPPPAALDSLPLLEKPAVGMDSLPPLNRPREAEGLQTLPTEPAAGDGTETGTVFEVDAKEVRSRTPPAPSPAPGRSPTPRSSTPPARTAGASPVPRPPTGPLPPTRMHRSGPKAGAAQRAPDALRDLAPALEAGRDHGRLLGILLGVAMAVLAMLGTQGTGAGTDLTLLVAVLAGGVAALAGAWLLANPVVRGAVLLAAGLVPLGVLLATTPPALADLGELAAAPGPGGRTSLVAAAWLFRDASPWICWLGAAAAVALLAALRTARLWPESWAPRLMGVAAGGALVALWLLPLPSEPGGPELPARRLLAIALHARPPAELATLGVPLAALAGLALVAGRRLVSLTWIAPGAVALALCWPALAHLALSGVRLRVLTQASLAALPAPLVFVAAIGLSALVMGVLTTRRPEARELLERL